MHIGHHGVIAGVGAIPFQHREFGKVQIAALAVAEHPGEFEDFCLARGEQFLGGEFRRGAQVSGGARAVGTYQFRLRSV